MLPVAAVRRKALLYSVAQQAVTVCVIECRQQSDSE